MDDTAEMRFLYGKILRSAGYSVTEAESGRTAVEHVERDPPDLVVLDWMMPDMSGLEVLEQVRARPQLADLPVILLTAAGHRDDLISRVLDLGARDFITKPVNRRLLLTRVQAVLDSSTHEKAALTAQRMSKENDDLLVELERAKRLQQAQVPSGGLRHGGWLLHGALYPCAHVGGDLFDVIDVTADGCTVALVDVSGHGIAAAMVATGVRSTLRLLAKSLSLGELLECLNTQLCNASDEHYACVALVRTAGQRIEVVNAGLPSVWIVGAAGGLSKVEASGPPPGLLPGSSYATTRLEAAPGDWVAMASDGFVELFDAPGDAVIVETLRSLEALEGDQWSAHVERWVELKRRRQTDDATLLTLRSEARS